MAGWESVRFRVEVLCGGRCCVCGGRNMTHDQWDWNSNMRPQKDPIDPIPFHYLNDIHGASGMGGRMGTGAK